MVYFILAASTVRAILLFWFQKEDEKIKKSKKKRRRRISVHVPNSNRHYVEPASDRRSANQSFVLTQQHE